MLCQSHTPRQPPFCMRTHISVHTHVYTLSHMYVHLYSSVFYNFMFLLNLWRHSEILFCPRPWNLFWSCIQTDSFCFFCKRDLFSIFNCIYMCVSLCGYAHMNASVCEDSRGPWTWSQRLVWVTWHACWESNTGPLQGQEVILRAQPTPQPQRFLSTVYLLKYQ